MSVKSGGGLEGPESMFGNSLIASKQSAVRRWVPYLALQVGAAQVEEMSMSRSNR